MIQHAGKKEEQKGGNRQQGKGKERTRTSKKLTDCETDEERTFYFAGKGTNSVAVDISTGEPAQGGVVLSCPHPDGGGGAAKVSLPFAGVAVSGLFFHWNTSMSIKKHS